MSSDKAPELKEVFESIQTVKNFETFVQQQARNTALYRRTLISEDVPTEEATMLAGQFQVAWMAHVSIMLRTVQAKKNG